MPWIVPDYETASMCDLKLCGAARYAEDVTTEVLSLCWGKTLGGYRIHWHPGLPRPEEWDRAIKEGWMFVAHNVDFERWITEKIMVAQWGWPAVPDDLWHDTMAKCAMLSVPLKLEKAIHTLGLPEEKDTEGSKLTIGLSKINKRTGMLPTRTPEIMQRVYDYNERDIDSQIALHTRIGWLPPAERRVQLLVQEINQRGLAIDVPLVRNMKKIVDEASGPLSDRFIELTGVNMAQGAKVKAWLHENGALLPNLQKETVAKALGQDVDGEVDEDELHDPGAAPLSPEVREALQIKQLIGSSSVKKLDRMEAIVCSDGRARGLIQYHGTMPGRNAGRLLNPHNFPKPTLDWGKDFTSDDKQAALLAALQTGDYRYVEATCGPAVESVVNSLRYALIAGKGRKFVAGDFAGIQARVVLGLAGQYDKVALMASGVDVYCDMASLIFKRTITKADAWERGLGKNSVLGLGFQMGAAKFQWKYAPDLDIETVEALVRTYRQEWAPLVPKVWYGLQDAATKAVWDNSVEEAYGIEYRLEDLWLTARLPSGRKMWYFNPKPIRKAMPWDVNDVRCAFTYEATKQGKRLTIDAFGGQLTENVVMGIERDLMTTAMFKCKAEGFPIALEVHDEIVTEPLDSADDKVLEQIMQDTPQWARAMKIPVATELWSNDRYRK